MIHLKIETMMKKKTEQNIRKRALRLFLMVLSLCLLLPVGLTACSSEEEDINYTAEVIAFDSAGHLGRAKIIHSAKGDKHSEHLTENAQFLFVPLPLGNSYNLEEGCIITFKTLRLRIPKYAHTGDFNVFEIEITKIRREEITMKR